MKHTSIGVVASLASAAALAQSVGFDSDADRARSIRR